MGIGRLENLLTYLLTVIICACTVVLALLWSPQSPGRRSPWDGPWRPAWPSIRRRVIAVYGMIFPALIVLFAVASPIAPPDSTAWFETDFAGRPALFALQMVFQGGYLCAMGSLIHIAWQRAAALPRGHTARRGLRWVTAGAALTALYSLCIIAANISLAAGRHALEIHGTQIGPAFILLGAVAFFVAWASTAVTTRRRRRADYRALAPLWRTCLQADARLLLDEAGGRAFLPSRDLEWRTTRRTMEIRDGQLVMSPWVDQQVIDAAAQCADREGLTGADRDAMIAASALAGALRARQARRPPGQTAVVPGMDVTPAAERDHLVAVSRYLHTPLVDRVLAETS